MTTIGAPVPETERHDALDLLRGVAVLGILIMNVQSFAMPFSAYFNPTALGPPSTIDFAVWTVNHLFADQKSMSMFSILFGAGVLLFATRAVTSTGRSAALHYRRMVWLLVFGLVHAYLLWYGDILVLYAVCGMLIYPLRRFGPRTLLVLGTFVVSVAALFMALAGMSIDRWPPEAVAEMREFWSPDAATLAAEFEAFRGGWLTQLPVRAAYAFDFHTFEMWVWGLWRAGGLMLIGMALFKLGVLTGERPRALYLRMAVLGFIVGPLLTGWGIVRHIAEGWRVEYSFFVGGLWNYWGSVFTAFGWMGIVLALWKSGALHATATRLAALGRIAFTCYIAETLICTSLFYGHGVGLFGSVGRLDQMMVVVAVWGVLLWFAPWWLERYRFGPLEWLWRTLTYGRIEPLSRELRSPRPAL